MQRPLVLAVCFCVGKVALSLPMRGGKGERFLQRFSARIRLIIIPQHLSLPTLGGYCISTSQL